MTRESPGAQGRAHWETVHATRAPDSLSWYQANPMTSVDLIRSFGSDPNTAVIDIGGGSSLVVDHLLEAGYTDLTVLDISEKALEIAKTRLASASNAVQWVSDDILQYRFPRTYEIWHDRAAFHFLIDTGRQQRYIDRMRTSLQIGGVAIIATFAPDGPSECSGLPVQRYSEETLTDKLGSQFKPLRFDREAHDTPQGKTQHFLYGCYERQ